MVYGSLAPYAILEGSWQPVGNWLPYITWCAMRTNKSLSAKVRMAWSHREAPVFQTNNESLLSDTGACGGVPQGTHCGRPGAVSPPQLWHGGGILLGFESAVGFFLGFRPKLGSPVAETPTTLFAAHPTAAKEIRPKPS